MSSQEKTNKEKRFKLMPNGAANTNLYQLCSYQNPKTLQFTWIDNFGKVHVGSDQPNSGIRQHVFNSQFPFYEIVIKENMLPEPKKKLEAEIAWYKAWPLVGRALPDGAIDSYPHENHKAQFFREYDNGRNKDEALLQRLQPLRYYDYEEIQSISLKDARFKRKLGTALEAITGNKDLLTKISYLLGINPYGMDADSIEFAIDEAVTNGTKGNDFLRIIDEEDYNDAYTYAVNVGITMGIIVVNEDGFYQYNSNPIARKKESVIAHMKEKSYDFNGLISDLAEKSIVIDLDAKKNKKKNSTNAKSDEGQGIVTKTGAANDDAI